MFFITQQRVDSRQYLPGDRRHGFYAAHYEGARVPFAKLHLFGHATTMNDHERPSDEGSCSGLVSSDYALIPSRTLTLATPKVFEPAEPQLSYL